MYYSFSSFIKFTFLTGSSLFFSKLYCLFCMAKSILHVAFTRCHGKKTPLPTMYKVWTVLLLLLCSYNNSNLYLVLWWKYSIHLLQLGAADMEWSKSLPSGLLKVFKVQWPTVKADNLNLSSLHYYPFLSMIFSITPSSFVMYYLAMFCC